jgi:hypothetical protein
VTLKCSELLCGSDNHHPFAIPNKDGALAGCHKYSAILAVVDVQVGSYVEDKELRVLTIINVELLLFYRINFLYLK